MKTTFYFSVQTQNEETYCYAEEKKEISDHLVTGHGKAMDYECNAF